MLVTSADLTDAKTLSSVELSMTLARLGGRVLLIDADVRNPTVHKTLGIPNEVGIGEVVAGGVGTMPVLELTPFFSVMLAGTSRDATPDGIFHRDAFSRALVACAREFEWVLLDAPRYGARETASLLRAVPAFVFVIDEKMAFRVAGDALAALDQGSKIGTIVR